MSSPLIHFEVTGQDSEKLKGFYGDLFAWKFNNDNPLNYGMVGLSDDIGGGVGAAQEGPGAAMFYIAVDDCESSLDKAEQLGGSRVWGPVGLPSGTTIAHFADPEGHVVGVFSRM